MNKKEEILGVATLSVKHQITITKPIRKILGLNPGDRVVFIRKDNEIILRKA
jgi:AbrB family looped-hinge helix DNA binding protein